MFSFFGMKKHHKSLKAEKYGWPIIPIDTGHDAMVSAPEVLSELLMSIS